MNAHRSHRIALAIALAACFAGGATREASAFGLKDWTAGDRYHYLATVKGLSPSFDADAAHWIGWNDDALDVYSTPHWIDVLNYMKYEWQKLHSDDLYGADQIAVQMDRYVQGTFYGLLWIAQNPDFNEAERIYAAYHLMGVTFHAVQDFYSHSTWVDDQRRRSHTAFSYNRSAFLAIGKPLYTASMDEDQPEFGRGYIAGFHKYHGGGATGTPKKLFSGLRHQCYSNDDQGINLDRPCSAEIAAKNRALSDHASADELFNAAFNLAAEATRELAAKWGAWLERAGQGAFWARVKAHPPAAAGFPARPKPGDQVRASYFDKKCSLKSYDWGTPFTFSAGGTYKTDKPWHFRIQIDSAANLKSVVSFVPKLPGALPIPLNRKDFDEEFDKDTRASYVSGPFASFPPEISFIVGKGAGTWPVHRIRVWAYRIGDATDAKLGLVLDVKDLVLSKGGVKSFKVTEPKSMGFKLHTFAESSASTGH